ncbi:hypothetical protein J3R82DRAFT_3549 [Butyriboletus roseoflavus]|nr:hypothetical protein J3R82DRAFT_3549 [Butyriboletus roseoflavus]
MADTDIDRSPDFPDEETPLWRSKNNVKDSPSPLPKLQLSILLMMLLAEPVSFSSMSPYISRLISGMEVTHGDESQVGYYIGLMVCSIHCVTGRCALIRVL